MDFGITDNVAYKLLEEKIKRVNYLHRFYANGKDFVNFKRKIHYL